jgi:hypothetical protein
MSRNGLERTPGLTAAGCPEELGWNDGSFGVVTASLHGGESAARGHTYDLRRGGSAVCEELVKVAPTPTVAAVSPLTCPVYDEPNLAVAHPGQHALGDANNGEAVLPGHLRRRKSDVMPAQLLTERGPTSHPILLLQEGVVTQLGRNPSNTLVLTDRHVSRWHATITSRSGRFFLRDQNSINGTRIDGRLIECETPLLDGQLIRMGSVQMRFQQLPDSDGRSGPSVWLDPAWLLANDRAAIHLAATIAGEGSFDLMPILADALEDAGCTDVEVLTHCRQAGPHARCCWVLDLIFPTQPTSAPRAIQTQCREESRAE